MSNAANGEAPELKDLDREVVDTLTRSLAAVVNEHRARRPTSLATLLEILQALAAIAAFNTAAAVHDGTLLGEPEETFKATDMGHPNVEDALEWFEQAFINAYDDATCGKGALHGEMSEPEREAQARRVWERCCASGRKPADIPERPDLVYGKEWKGWVDWLGWPVTVRPRHH